MKKDVPVEIVHPAAKDKKSLLSDKADASRYHWSKQLRFKWTITYFFGSFFVYSVRSAMSVCVPVIGKELGWSKQISGIALSAFLCGYVSTNVLGGYLADRYGGEQMIIYSGTVWASMTILLPYLANSDSFFMFGSLAVIFARVLTGMAQGFYYPSFVSILSKHVPVEDSGFLSGFTFSGSSVGTISTGFAGALIIDYFGWRLVFIAIGVPSLMWITWLRYFYHKTNLKDEIVVGFKPKEPVPWRKLASKGAVWGLVIAYFCNGLTFFIVLSWTPVYFHDAFPDSKGWVFNVVPWLLNFVITNLASYFANVFLQNGTSVTTLRKTYAAIMLLGISVFSYMLTLAETFYQALFVMSLNIGFNGFSSTSLGLNAMDLCPQHAGALHGVINSLAAMAGVVGVYLTGYILETTQNWSLVFILASSVSFTGFLGFQILGTAERII